MPMGLFDRLTFEDGLAVAFPDIDADPLDVTWQTKSISRRQPMMENYRVTSEGRLLREIAEYEPVPEEERPGYDEALEGFESEVDRMFGSIRKVHRDWTDTSYHGTFEFHSTIDEEYVSLEATFTDGHLVEITRTDATAGIST